MYFNWCSMKKFFKNNGINTGKIRSLDDKLEDDTFNTMITRSVPTFSYYNYTGDTGNKFVTLNKATPEDKNIAVFSMTQKSMFGSYVISGNNLIIHYDGFSHPNNDDGLVIPNEDGSFPEPVYTHNSVEIKDFFLGKGFNQYQYFSMTSYNSYEFLSASDTSLYFSGKQTDLFKTTTNNSNVVVGDSSDSWLLGNDKDNIIVGGSGNETIFANNDGNNTIIAGKGDDTIIIGLRENDRLLFSKGDGNDTIIMAPDNTLPRISSTIQFTDAASSEIISIKRSVESASLNKNSTSSVRTVLTIQYTNQDSVTVSINSPYQPDNGNFLYQFSDKTLTTQELLDLYPVTDNASITPSVTSDTQQMKNAVVNDFYKADANIKDPSVITKASTYGNMEPEQQSTLVNQIPFLTTTHTQNDTVLVNI